MAATLDTLQIVKRLKEAGFGDSQAEAITGVVRDLAERDRADLATKADIAMLKGDIERVETKLTLLIDAKISEAKTDVIRWVFGIAFAQAALILAVLKLFPATHP